MRISLKWLKEFIDIDMDVDTLADTMTQLGMEVESIERQAEDIQNVVVGKVLERNPHPDADKLSVCKTDIGQAEPLQIICGADNYNAGDRVPTAIVGATLPGGFEIGRRKMRGVESFGMMCSPKELGMGEDHDGLLVLPEDAPIGEDIRSYLGLDDVSIEIEVTPNRGDWAGMIGIARDLAAKLDTNICIPEVALKETAPAEDDSLVTIDAPDLCPRYCARIVRNVKIEKSPQWIVDRLIAAGQRPINNIVDITNLVLLETAQPLHAFDLNTLSENRIVVRRAGSGETIKTIDGEERKLTPDMMVIADAKNPIAIAGIMGGFDSEVTEKTTDILIESASFCPKSIRSTSRTLNLRSEASQRFQRGCDRDMAVWAADRAAALIAEVAGGEIAPMVDAHPAPTEPPIVSLRYSRVNEFLGQKIDADKQTKILEALGFKTLKNDTETCQSKVPAWRPDVSGEHDLIEEVARIYGYDRIEATIPRVRFGGSQSDNRELEIRALRDRLVGMGFNEWIGLSFTSAETIESLLNSNGQSMAVQLQNPISENLAIMRPSLLPGVLQTAANNLRKGVRGIRAFEIGHVYSRDDTSPTSAKQTLQLVIVMTGEMIEKHWSTDTRMYDIQDILGVMETMSVTSHISKPSIDIVNEPGFHPHQCLAFTAKNKKIAVLGRPTADLEQAVDLPHAAYVAVIEVEEFLETAQQPEIDNDIPQFPGSQRDIAVVVPENQDVGPLIESIQKVGGKYLTAVELIDIYRGKQIEAGQKSLAFNLSYQAQDRTLTDKDTDKSWKKILRTLEHQFGAQLR